MAFPTKFVIVFSTEEVNRLLAISFLLFFFAILKYVFFHSELQKTIVCFLETMCRNVYK